jgi:hypothetical protein
VCACVSGARVENSAVRLIRLSRTHNTRQERTVETYFFSLLPRKIFLHPYAITAPTATRYHTGRRPRTGMFRCGISSGQHDDFLCAWTARLKRDAPYTARHRIRPRAVSPEAWWLLWTQLLAITVGEVNSDACGGERVPRDRAL